MGFVLDALKKTMRESARDKEWFFLRAILFARLSWTSKGSQLVGGQILVIKNRITTDQNTRLDEQFFVCVSCIWRENLIRYYPLAFWQTMHTLSWVLPKWGIKRQVTIFRSTTLKIGSLWKPLLATIIVTIGFTKLCSAFAFSAAKQRPIVVMKTHWDGLGVAILLLWLAQRFLALTSQLWGLESILSPSQHIETLPKSVVNIVPLALERNHGKCYRRHRKPLRAELC